MHVFRHPSYYKKLKRAAKRTRTGERSSEDASVGAEDLHSENTKKFTNYKRSSESTQASSDSPRASEGVSTKEDASDSIREPSKSL